jgi:hypothetical protein
MKIFRESPIINLIVINKGKKKSCTRFLILRFLFKKIRDLPIFCIN